MENKVKPVKKVSKIFKITLYGEYAEDYEHTHSDLWIEDFFFRQEPNLIDIEEVNP